MTALPERDNMTALPERDNMTALPERVALFYLNNVLTRVVGLSLLFPSKRQTQRINTHKTHNEKHNHIQRNAKTIQSLC